MAEYFTRKINEGTVKRTHLCSFDKSIKLEMIVTNSRKVLDNMVKRTAQKAGEEKDIEAKNLLDAKNATIDAISALRINGLSIIYEDLGSCFDDDEIVEVIGFVNGVDMKIFGGDAPEVPK